MTATDVARLAMTQPREGLVELGNRRIAPSYNHGIDAAPADEQRDLAVTPQVPVLYLHGEADGCLLPALASSARDVLAPGSEVEIIVAPGRFLQLEQRERTAELVLSFLDRQET